MGALLRLAFRYLIFFGIVSTHAQPIAPVTKENISSQNFSILSLGVRKDCSKNLQTVCEVDLKVNQYTPASELKKCSVAVTLPKYVLAGRQSSTGSGSKVSNKMKWILSGADSGKLKVKEIKIDPSLNGDPLCARGKKGLYWVYNESDDSYSLTGLGRKLGKDHVCFYEISVGPPNTDEVCDPVDPVVVIQD